MRKLSLILLLGALTSSACVFADNSSRQAQIAQAQARTEQSIQTIQKKQQADKQAFDQALQVNAISKAPEPLNRVTSPSTGTSSTEPNNVPQRKVFTPQQSSPSNDITGFSSTKGNPPKQKSNWEYGF